MSLTASGNEMVIRNMGRTYRVSVPDVRGFDISGRGRTNAIIRVLTSTGAIPAEATGRSLHTPKRGQAWQERQLQELTSWLGPSDLSEE